VSFPCINIVPLLSESLSFDCSANGEETGHRASHATQTLPHTDLFGGRGDSAKEREERETDCD
jgi:hypothetical protein